MGLKAKVRKSIPVREKARTHGQGLGRLWEAESPEGFLGFWVGRALEPEFLRFQDCSLAQAACGIWVGGAAPNPGSVRCWQQLQASHLCLLLFPGLRSFLHRPQRRSQRKLLLILAAIPGHPHPQLPLCLSPFRGTQSLSEPQLRALRGEHIPRLPSGSCTSLILELQDQGSSPAQSSAYCILQVPPPRLHAHLCYRTDTGQELTSGENGVGGVGCMHCQPC